jgi:hypothetical protein
MKLLVAGLIAVPVIAAGWWVLGLPAVQSERDTRQPSSVLEQPPRSPSGGVTTLPAASSPSSSTSGSQEPDLSWTKGYPNRVTTASLKHQARALLGQQVAISVQGSIEIRNESLLMLGPIPIRRSWNPELFSALINSDSVIEVVCGGVCRVECRGGDAALVIDPEDFQITDVVGGGVLSREALRTLLGTRIQLGGASRPEPLATKLCKQAWKPSRLFGKPVDALQQSTLRMNFLPDGSCELTEIMKMQYRDIDGMRWLGAEYWSLTESGGDAGLSMFTSEPKPGVQYDLFLISIDENNVLKMAGSREGSEMEWIDATAR